MPLRLTTGMTLWIGTHRSCPLKEHICYSSTWMCSLIYSYRQDAVYPPMHLKQKKTEFFVLNTMQPMLYP